MWISLSHVLRFNTLKDLELVYNYFLYKRNKILRFHKRKKLWTWKIHIIKQNVKFVWKKKGIKSLIQYKTLFIDDTIEDTLDDRRLSIIFKLFTNQYVTKSFFSRHKDSLSQGLVFLFSEYDNYRDFIWYFDSKRRIRISRKSKMFIKILTFRFCGSQSLWLPHYTRLVCRYLTIILKH